MFIEELSYVICKRLKVYNFVLLRVTALRDENSHFTFLKSSAMGLEILSSINGNIHRLLNNE